MGTLEHELTLTTTNAILRALMKHTESNTHTHTHTQPMKTGGMIQSHYTIY